MQYSKAIFRYNFDEDYLEDVLFQGLADLGFETFDGQEAYIQTELLNEPAVRNFMDVFSAQFAANVELVAIEACPDQNWNETWESEHTIEQLPMGVRIVPHCAFGAGHHQTTGMMIEALMAGEQSLAGKTVLDNGCGTGVLGIFAAKMGADVIAVDIDDKSVINTQENAALNDIHIDARLGCTPPEGNYDIILSNIHRNILLAQMPLYAHYLQPNGRLMLSGFLEEDIPLLREAAAACGLMIIRANQRDEWRMLELTHCIESTHEQSL